LRFVMNRTLWPHENLLTTACIDRRYFIELTLLRSLIKIKTVKETIFKAQVYNGSEKTTVKQHRILRGSLSVAANSKFAVSFLRAY